LHGEASLMIDSLKSPFFTCAKARTPNKNPGKPRILSPSVTGFFPGRQACGLPWYVFLIFYCNASINWSAKSGKVKNNSSEKTRERTIIK